ncbi:MAG: YdeI/OmpD-associated family protein [Bacteroidales bacterium]|nr:YdeI/OmpD-associated family protein [Bacteroidales bacterium]
MSDYTIQWTDELAVLKGIIEKSGLECETKWGADVFTFQGKNVISYGGFKHYFALWFYNGVFLKDESKKLINAQEGKTRALRQWRFTTANEIDEKLILAYIGEAIQIEKDGLVLEKESSSSILIPEILAEQLQSKAALNAAFNALTAYKQKEYIEFINAAKRTETRLNRLKKIIPMIESGKGLNDRYR